jgi:hypothetical protein
LSEPPRPQSVCPNVKDIMHRLSCKMTEERKVGSDDSERVGMKQRSNRITGHVLLQIALLSRDTRHSVPVTLPVQASQLLTMTDNEVCLTSESPSDPVCLRFFLQKHLITLRTTQRRSEKLMTTRSDNEY